MKRWSSVFALMIGFSMSAVALAEPETPVPVEYGFDDELVTGDLIRPDGEDVHVRRRSMRASLVEVRSTYVPELLKSVEDL